MKKIILLILVCRIFSSQAQEIVKKNLEVGSYLIINTCKKNQKEFEFIDVYARSKPYDKSLVDTLTGDGLMKLFFQERSIDAKRLPCVMGGHTYKIGSLHEFDDKGKTKRVVLCYTLYDLTLIWIELDKALEAGEISF